MADIFLSHAGGDKKLADLLTSFLKEAIGVPNDAIFCSSVPGHGIPLGVDFNTYMRDRIQHPKLVIMLMTEAYMESAFCLMELGAAWALSHRSLPIVVPPIEFSRVSQTLGLVQGWPISDHSKLVDLRNLIQEVGISLEPRNEHTWDKKRTEWRTSLRKVLNNLPKATKVSADEYRAALQEAEEQTKEIEALTGNLERAEETIEKLKATRNKEDVQAVLRQMGGGSPEDRFDELMEEVRRALPDAAPAVIMHIIMDHYDKAGRIDWMHERDAFEDAVQRNLLSADEESRVLWDGRKLKSFSKALCELDAFMASEEGELAMKAKEDEPMEPNDRDFWVHHLRN